MEGLSIILPVKNEPYLPQLIENIEKLFEWTKELRLLPYEILVQEEKGLTNAVVQGVKKSRFETILVMDADGSHNPLYIHIMYDLARPFDLVVGTKVIDETAKYRQWISKFYRGMARAMINEECQDPMAGFVCGKRKWFELLKPSMDYKFLLQLLYYQPHIYNLPIAFHERKQGKSKANILTGIRTMYNIFKIALWGP